MQFIKRMRIVPVADQRYFMLNGMTGAIDLIDETVYQLYQKWSNAETIVPQSSFEEEMLANFQSRDYIMKPAQEEAKVTELFSRLENSFLSYKPRISPTFLLTYDCNFRCSYCYEQNLLEQGPERIKERLSPKIIAQLFKSFDQRNMTLGEIVLYGGEPLLLQNKDTVQAILDQAIQRDVAVKVVTNGFTLDEYAPLLAEAKIQVIQITLDGDEERHNQTRYTLNNKGTFTKILQGITKAREYDLPITIRCNLEIQDDDQIQSLIDALEAYGLHNDPGIRLYFAPIADEDGQACGTEVMTKFLTKVDEHLTHPLVVKDFLSRVHAIASVFLNKENWVPKYAFCGAQYGQQIFDPWGHIYPCQVLVGNPEEAIGTFDEKGIQYNDKYTAWDHRTIDKIDKCRECEIALFCGGGCPITPVLKTGNVNHHYCNDLQDTLQVLLPYLYQKYYAGADNGVNATAATDENS